MNFIAFVYLFMCVYAHTCFWNLVHSVYRVGPEDRTWVIRSSSRNLCRLTYLASPHTMSWYKSKQARAIAHSFVKC